MDSTYKGYPHIYVLYSAYNTFNWMLTPYSFVMVSTGSKRDTLPRGCFPAHYQCSRAISSGATSSPLCDKNIPSKCAFQGDGFMNYQLISVLMINYSFCSIPCSLIYWIRLWEGIISELSLVSYFMSPSFYVPILSKNVHFQADKMHIWLNKSLK